MQFVLFAFELEQTIAAKRYWRIRNQHPILAILFLSVDRNDSVLICLLYFSSTGVQTADRLEDVSNRHFTIELDADNDYYRHFTSHLSKFIISPLVQTFLLFFVRPSLSLSFSVRESNLICHQSHSSLIQLLLLPFEHYIKR